MSPLDLLPWWAKALIVAAAIAAAAWAVHTYNEHLRETGRVEIRAQWTAAADKANKELAAERAAKDEQQKENDHVEALARSRIADDAARAHAAGDRLQQRVDRLLAARPDDAQGAPAAGQRPGEQGPAADSVLSDVFSRLRGAGGELGKYADLLRVAGERCERGYDTEVTPAPASP